MRDRIRIGRLAEQTGLTVRTLRYYDEIGLLVPKDRTDGGERIYRRADLERLERIVLMRGLGLSLEEIGQLIDDAGCDVASLIARHRRRLEEERAGIDVIVERLDRIAASIRLREEDRSNINPLIRAIEEEAMIEKYYSDEQRRELAERAAELGEEGMRRAESEWRDLIAEVRAARDEGADPTGERALDLARRYTAMIAAFTGGNRQIQSSLKQMYKQEGPEKASHGTIDRETMEWLGEAMGVVSGGGSEGS